MINLAGVSDADRTIRRELNRCGIDVVEHDKPLSDPEMIMSVTGRLRNFTFRRAWYYWIVVGEMPLEIAKRLYEHPVGRTDIRVAGHCGCPAPEPPWVEYRDADDNVLVHDPDGRQERECKALASRFQEQMKGQRFVTDAAACATRAFIDMYHVDSELGTYLLAEAIQTIPTKLLFCQGL